MNLLVIVGFPDVDLVIGRIWKEGFVVHHQCIQSIQQRVTDPALADEAARSSLLRAFLI